MLTRRSAIVSLLTFYACFVFLFAFWANHAWLSSSPIASAAVKGASTASLVGGTASDAPTLTSYPQLTVQDEPYIPVQAFALYDVESGKMLLAKEGDTPRPIASTTKMMTSIVTLQHASAEEVVTISREAAGQIGSLMTIYPGEKLTVEALLNGMLSVSGNDAAYALAEYVGAKLAPNTDSDTQVSRFVEEMNREAEHLAMTHTRYHDPAGLNDDGRSTPEDQAKLASRLIQIPELRKIIGTTTLTVFDQQHMYRHDLRNSNWLLTTFDYPGIIGGKTGFTPDAGHCLVTAATRNGHTLIAAVYHTYDEIDPSASARAARQLLDLGFSATQWK